ncbi:MAG TPA: sulfotransferase [Xanthomonadaceae bacterium]|jgi:tetratricopeptide (TPR) repeat protein
MTAHALDELHSRAVAALQRRNWSEALDASMRLLQQEPRRAEANHIAAVAALELQQWTQALTCSRQAMQLDPARGDFAAQFAKALSVTNMHGEALKVANRTLCVASCDAITLDMLGVVYTRANAHERAASVFSRAAAQAPGHAGIRYNHAMSLMYLGQVDAAQTELGACLALEPRYWQAHYSVSGLRRQSAADNHVERLQALVQQHAGDATARMYLHMALGKEFEDLGDFPRAFDHFTQAKQAVKPTRADPIRRDEALFDALMRAFPEPQPQPAGCRSDEPIFVMGMPRTGTTLVERIVSSHPFVYSAGELHNFGLAFKHASGVRTPAMLDPETIAQTGRIRWDHLGEHYVSSTRPLTDGKPRFVDKLPHNFLWLGHIARALPNAKIVCLRRHPLDTCLGNFREIFTPGSEFHDYALDLLDAGRYYLLFDRLMAHWKRVFPGRILELHYESLVDSPEAVTRRLLAHCDLPWNDACLRFDTRQAPSTTASAVQVREPIHRRGVGRWRNYAPGLSALRKLLEDAGIDCGD